MNSVHSSSKWLWLLSVIVFTFASSDSGAIQLPAPAGKTLPASEAPQPMKFTKQTFTYKQAGDCAIQADVYRAHETTKQPVILWIHGGALIMGDRSGLRRDQLDRYLKAGYIVVAIDYRLAPETKLKEIIEDLRDAYAWIRAKGPEQFGADPNRIAVIGHSAGGYLTLMTGFAVNPRPKALVSFYGYGDIAGDWYSRPDPFYNQQPKVTRDEAFQAVGSVVIAEGSGRNRSRFYLYCRQQGLWPKEVAGPDPDKDPKAFDPFCPVRNVTRDYSPALLLHGDQDTDVPYQQSVLMAEEMKRQHVRHELIKMPGRGHGFDGGRDAMKDPVIAKTFDRVVAFLHEHLKH
jgi:acetyl esterase/lipase